MEKPRKEQELLGDQLQPERVAVEGKGKQRRTSLLRT